MTRPVALVTGSSRGIGLAAAQALAEDGVAVGLNAPSDDAELRAAAAWFETRGHPVTCLPFDVTDLAAHAPALDALAEALGPVTTLVNNAGVGVLARGDPLEVGTESWERCMAVNAKAPFFLSQAFAKHLLARPATEGFRSIVNVTSSNATAVAVPRAEYCASKAAAAMVSKVFAARLGAEGIAVYDVQPGLIETAMTAGVVESYRARAQAGLTLIPRTGRADEIGRVIATLATGRLPYTTGHVVSADGGMLVPRF